MSHTNQVDSNTNRVDKTAPQEPMSDTNRLDRTAPLELLLESANRSAAHLQRAYLEFTLVWTYYILVVGTTDHWDLLLDKTQSLPIFGFNLTMPVEIAYVLGPPLFLVLHAYLLAQHRLAAPQFHALRTWRRDYTEETYRFRGLMILPSPLAHLVLKSAISRYANSLLTVIALFGMPLLLFCLVIYFFLPYHGKWQTSLQLLFLSVDMLLLWFYWPLIAAPDGRWKTWWGSVSDLLFLAASARTAYSRDRRVVLGKKGDRIEKDAGYKSAIPDPIPIGWQQICNTTKNRSCFRCVVFRRDCRAG